MDIEKEREAFERYIQTVAHPHRSPKVMFFTVNDGHGNVIYCDISIQNQWETWQAAKAQAVPEGFILVRKEPDADLVNHGHQVFLGHFNEGGQTGGRSLYFAYKAMIEAQEPTND